MPVRRTSSKFLNIGVITVLVAEIVREVGEHEENAEADNECYVQQETTERKDGTSDIAEQRTEQSDGTSEAEVAALVDEKALQGVCALTGLRDSRCACSIVQCVCSCDLHAEKGLLGTGLNLKCLQVASEIGKGVQGAASVVTGRTCEHRTPLQYLELKLFSDTFSRQVTTLP